jgi:hypothetical protein
MGVNPYTYARAPLQAPLDKGMLSHGALYNTKDLLDMMDGLISDVNHNIKEAVAASLNVYVSPDRPAGPLGEPMIDIKMGPREINKLWIGEDTRRNAAPETNIDVFKLWSIARELTQTVAIAPVLLGLLGSDQSGVLYNTAAAFAAKQYGPATAALEESAKGIAKRLCRSVYKTLKEPVTFYLPIDGAYSKVELTPKEAMMWEDRIQVSIPLAVAENDNALAEQARLLTDKQNKLLSKRTAQSQLLKVADTFAENERIADEDIEDALAPILAQMVQQALVDDLNDPGQGAAPETPFGAAVFDALMQKNGLGGKQGGGQVARSAANSVREGVPTNPYQTESQNLTPESALAP